MDNLEKKPEEPESSYDLPPEPYVAPKQRHGCLTAWLYYIIAGNTISIVLNFLQINTIAEALKISPIWVLAALRGKRIEHYRCNPSIQLEKNWVSYHLASRHLCFCSEHCDGYFHLAGTCWPRGCDCALYRFTDRQYLQ